MAAATAGVDTGTKRPHDSFHDHSQHVAKKRRVHHVLRNAQNSLEHVEPAAQDQVFAQGQLMRSISAALVMAGFDSVRPSALEMFRSHAEEYMLQFLRQVRHSMREGRRSRPTAQDFAATLAKTPNTATASHLAPQLGLPVPEGICRPFLSQPDPPPQAALDLSQLLEPMMTSRPPSYIPKHFPPLPSQHAWTQTDVFPKREQDAAKMREKATEEGTMAESALRRLAAAAKAGAMKAERRRQGLLSGAGVARARLPGSRNRPRANEDTFGDVLKDVGDSDEATELGLDGSRDAVETGMDLGMPEGVIVNHNMVHWRHGRHRHGLHGFV